MTERDWFIQHVVVQQDWRTSVTSCDVQS